jgi:nucleoside 2-deoxyribosyltransferase
MTHEPPEIRESLERFRQDHPDPNKAAFIMMKFGVTLAHQNALEAVRETLADHDISGVRADDKEYHPDLFYNILTYIYGCGFGIALFERIERDDFNPNVSLEVGYLMALNKPVCLLKDKTLQTLQTDLVGRLYRTFDPQNPSGSVAASLRSWMLDKGLIRNGRGRREIIISNVRATIGPHRHEGPRWNLHQLRFLKRENRDVEVDLKKATFVERRDMLRICFVFGLPRSYYITLAGADLLREYVNRGTLFLDPERRWIAPPRGDDEFLWRIRADLLLEDFPELEYLEWLDKEFVVHPTLSSSADHDEPNRCHKIFFDLKNERD